MSSACEQIDEILEQYEWYLQEVESGQDMPEAVKPKFEVKDKSAAEWVLRKIAKIETQKAENSSVASEQIEPLRAEIQKIQEWNQTEAQKLDKQIEFLKSLLYPYHMMVLEADPKAKTIKLPHGELKIRKQQPELQRDDEKLLQFLKDNELAEYVKVKESPDWAKFKPLTTVDNGKVIHTGTGQVVAGVVAVDRPDKFEVVVK